MVTTMGVAGGAGWRGARVEASVTSADARGGIGATLLETVARALARWPLTGAAPALEPADIEAIYALAHALFKESRWSQAADLFQLLVLCRPQQARGWLGLGGCREALQQRERALIAYEAGLVAPEGAEARDQMARRVTVLRAQARLPS